MDEKDDKMSHTFCNLALFGKIFTFRPFLKRFAFLDPGARRHDWWRRDYTAWRHQSWRRAPGPIQIRHRVAVDVARLGAVDLGAEIGATVLGAEPFLPSGKGGSQSI